jgi:hypothetical protein
MRSAARALSGCPIRIMRIYRRAQAEAEKTALAAGGTVGNSSTQKHNQGTWSLWISVIGSLMRKGSAETNPWPYFTPIRAPAARAIVSRPHK